MLFIYSFPALFFFFVFKYWPIAYSSILSFYKWNFVSTMKPIGFSNYTAMFGRAVFIKGLVNTLSYIIGLIPFFVIIPLLLALLLLGVKNQRAQNLYKAAFFMPTILALAIICMVWMWMFNPQFGLLNNLLGIVGHEGFSWLSDSRTAMLSIIMVSGWKFIGANMILFIAGILSISSEVVEAARIDGANAWQAFWHIKFPLLSPTTIYIVTTSVIFAAERAFTPINILTQGGPANTTTNLSHVIYEFGFKYYNIGLASATAIFTSVFFLIITLIMMKGMGGFSYYEN